jgi:capsular exopolysaccharide synthesis family protein
MPEPPTSQSSPESRPTNVASPVDSRLTEGPDTHLLDYVRVLYKRRWTAFTAFALVAGAITVYTFTATPVYEARTRLLLEAEQQHVVTFKQVVDEDQTKADYYQTQYNVLQSRALARRTIDGLKLWNTPPFGGTSDRRSFLDSAILGRPAAVAGLSASGNGPAAANGTTAVGEAETAAVSNAIDHFASQLTVSPIRNSRLVDVKYQHPDPAVATNIVNALARNYIEQNLEYRFTASKEASDWLGARLAEQRREVEATEARLQRYREQNETIARVDRDNITVQKLADLNAAVTRAKTDRLTREAVYRQLQAASDRGTLDTAPQILANAFIQQQKGELAALQQQAEQASGRLGKKHPDMIKLAAAIRLAEAKLSAEIEKIVQSVRSEYEAALAHENSMVVALNQQKAEALAMNRKSIEYSVLERDVESSTQLYNNLLQRTKETGVSGELRTSNIRVVDPAEKPRTPVRPNRAQNEFLALFLGTLCACGLVAFFEYMDSNIKSPGEIRGQLGLTHLGMLPVLQQKGDRYPLLSGGVPANFSEAFRTFRTNVLFSSAEEGGRALVITSTAPREGKSLVSSNLAIALAQAGQRTLLIDADMRKPKAHDIFVLSQEPGLSNVLVGDAPLKAAVRETTVAGLSVLVAGRIPPNPTELLGAPRFRELMTTVKSHFDWIIVDTPPVMAVADATLVSHLATGVVFVVGAEMTSRHAAKRALDQLQQVHAKFVGGVLNKVDLHRNPYYYSQYYRREYAQYYVKAS